MDDSVAALCIFGTGDGLKNYSRRTLRPRSGSRASGITDSTDGRLPFFMYWPA
ncbi:hypothetical protein ACFQH2_14350 [Natronoarchaeum sp. GCM10025703]|uniref:hypothetical protein n=1 Tax=Natronoarchaeum sp. GCM10025703 TaxID=3252685 RepID=UPI00360FD57E